MKPIKLSRRWVTALAALALASALAACGGSGSEFAAGNGGQGNANGSQLTTVKVVVIEGTQLFPIKVMQDQGFAKQHNIKLDVSSVTNPQAFYTQAQAPGFQVGFGAWPKIAQLRASGQDLTNVYSMYGYTNDLLVKKQSSINSFADLKGKDIGLFGGPGSGTTLMFRLEAKKFYGFDPAQASKIHYAAAPLLASQLKRGDLDAVLLLDPVLEPLLASGDYRSVGNLGEIWQQRMGQTPMLVSVTMSGEWAGKNPQAAKGFVAAFSEAQSYIKNHRKVWPGLAKSVGITDKSTVQLLRRRVSPALLNQWNQDFINQQRQFAKQLKAEFGASGDFPQQIPDGTFTLKYAPAS